MANRRMHLTLLWSKIHLEITDYTATTVDIERGRLNECTALASAENYTWLLRKVIDCCKEIEGPKTIS